MNLIVYKSSAGSGKTSTLVIEYLALALKKPRQFRQIIALTFTMKATQEMKDRLLNYLVQLQSIDPQSPPSSFIYILEKLKEITLLSTSQLQQNAHILLQKIIHNYSDFGFSTIDSFVVKIVRSFASDLKLSSNFEIELDQNVLIDAAMEHFYELIGTNQAITNFLIDFVLHQMEGEKSTDIDAPIKSLAALSFDSKHYENINLIKDIPLKNYVLAKQILKKDSLAFEEKMISYGKQGLQCIKSHGLVAKDCSNGWLFNYFNKIALKHEHLYDPEKLENKTFIKQIDNEGDWYAKRQESEIKERIDNAKAELSAIVAQTREYYRNNLPNYISYQLILKKLTPLALIQILKTLISRYSEDNNLIHLSEANRKIAEIVQGQSTPYIYERIGQRYNHYLIDEFQDTSVIQWNNLLPLIDNSLASGYKNLLVGDSKQSIYRWRDGDVEQFANLPLLKNPKNSQLIAEREQLIKQSIAIRNLNTNYRSDKNIVDFNNLLFSHLIKDENEYIKNIFTDYHQLSPKTEMEGMITLRYIDDKNNELLLENIHNKILNLIQEQHYSAGDICILARKNSTLIEIADYLVAHNIKVISKDALRIYKSKAVTLVISLMQISEKINIPINAFIVSKQLLNMEKQPMTGIHSAARLMALLNNNGYNFDLQEMKNLNALELAEYIIYKSHLSNSINPFLFKLLDIIAAQSVHNGINTSQFLDYWEKKKSSFSITISKNKQAIQLLTIHSSKGLEFPVVLFPMVKIGEDKISRDYLWVEPTTNIKSLLPKALIGFEAKGKISIYHKLIEQEENRKRLDNLNLIYVACTRASNQLHLFFSKEQKSEKLWKNYFSTLPLQNIPLTLQEEHYIEIGKPSIQNSALSIPQQENFKIKTYYYQQWQNRIRIKINSQQGTTINKREKGIHIHYILSQYNTLCDPKTLVDKISNTVGIDETTKSEYYSILKQIKNTSSLDCFFNETDKQLQERSIIGPNNTLLRPDKVIFKKNEIWVVDYKYADYTTISAQEKEKHLAQIRQYMTIIEGIEGKPSKGFLLYLQTLTVISC